MKRPDNINDALRHLHDLTMAIANDMLNYMDNPQDYSPEYFEDAKNAALDAHMLVTWVRDNFDGLHKDDVGMQREDRPSPTFVSARESAIDEQAAMYDDNYEE